MIKQLRRKFIGVTMTAAFIVVAIFVVAINLVYTFQTRQTSMAILQYLTDNDGAFPQEDKDLVKRYDQFTEETRFETRFFSVLFDADGNVISNHFDNVAAITNEEAGKYAEIALHAKRSSRYISDYRYLRTEKKNGDTLIVFVDCHTDKMQEQAYLFSSILVAGIGILLLYVLIYILSNKAIRPTIESMEKQKQFITDAGHEIKTPLAIITANTEVLELTQGENEWTTSIKNQTVRLNDLIQQMLSLARLQEMMNEEALASCDVSKLVMEETEPFITLAESKGKHLKMDVQGGIEGMCDEKGIRRLTSVLTENAVKYAEDASTVQVNLSAKGKKIKLEVRNAYVGADETAFKDVFRRFYRADKSRARETGGFGIGLSIAQAIVTGHKGKIAATVPEPNIVSFTAVWPKN